MHDEQGPLPVLLGWIIYCCLADNGIDWLDIGKTGIKVVGRAPARLGEYRNL